MANEDDEFPFLQEACSPKAAHKIDIVFVHGLNPRGSSRHPYETWTHQNGRFWPADFLAEDLPFARIFVYGYNSDVSQPEYMSVGRIKNHADTLLNLLDLERGSSQGPSPSRIIFIGHSLGGLVIKHALLNAQENPKYNAIRTATYGLVFFGCPHHGAKGAELGMIAADVARYVSADRASNELLESLKTNSLFTRQMSERFRHQLEDYRVVSFIEGLPMLLGGTGSTSISHVVVDEESAVLGLTGLRETQLMLDADHIGICKIGSRGAMYRMVKGNIKNLVDQALVTTQGYVPPPAKSPTPQTYPTPPSSNPFSPPLPPRPSASGSTYPPSQPPEQEQKVTGLLYPPIGDDKNSIQLSKYKNMGLWDKAQQLEQQIFQEQQRTLGPENLKTLTTGHNLAATYLELGFVNDATNWATWVATTSQRTLGPKHPLFMKNESLTGEILLEKGLYPEADTHCANILARQQDNLGDDHLDTLETQRRLGLVCKCLGRQQDALARLKKRNEALERVLGDTHILNVSAALDLIEVIIPHPAADTFGIARFANEVQQAAKIMPPLYQDLRGALGPQHPLSIRALRICGTVKSLEGNATEASDTLRRALSNAEEALGRESAETLNIVAMIGVLYGKHTPGLARSTGSGEMQPWLERYLAWTERRKGLNHPEVTATLGMLAMASMAEKDYLQAEKYYERLMAAYGPQNNSKQAQEAAQMLYLCQMNTKFLKPTNAGADIAGLLKGFRF